MCAQAGEAARAFRGYLGNQSAGAIYLAFMQHHLTGRSSTNKTVEVVMAFSNALVDLISAVPDASAPADQRLDRSPVWCTSGRHQSGSDMLFLPLKQQAQAADMAPGMEAFQQAPGKDAAHPTVLPGMVNLTRVQALDLFLSGVKPPDGPCLAILQDRSRPEGQRLAALQTLITFYGCKYNQIIADAHSATYACRLHFQGFVDAYASEDLQLSQQHLAALQALAKHKVINTFPLHNTSPQAYVAMSKYYFFISSNGTSYTPAAKILHDRNMCYSLHRERLMILQPLNR